MKSLKRKNNSILKACVIPIVLFALLIWLLVGGTTHFKKVGSEQGLALTAQAIRKAVLQCYAVEGMYPSDLEYLTEHYNLRIDEEKYIISYDCFSSNIMPEIDVFER